MKTMILCNKKREEFKVLLDDDDYERLSNFKWYLRDMKKAKICYAVRLISSKPVKWKLMHRDIIKADKVKVVDHIDGNGLNNTKSNLRAVTQSENMMNSRQYRRQNNLPRGVTELRHFSKKQGCVLSYYRTQIGSHGKNFYLGLFNTVEKARSTYLAAAKEIHGEYARS